MSKWFIRNPADDFFYCLLMLLADFLLASLSIMVDRNNNDVLGRETALSAMI